MFKKLPSASHPGNIMGGQDFAEIGCVDIEGKGISPDPAGLLGVPVRDAEAPPFIMDKSIERNFSFRTEIESKCLCFC